MRKSINFLLPRTDPNRFSIKVENLFNRFWRFCFGGRAVWAFRRSPSRRDWSFRFCPLGSRLRAKFAANKRTWRLNKTASRRRWKQSKIISTGRFDVYGPVFTSSLRCGLLHKWMTFFQIYLLYNNCIPNMCLDLISFPQPQQINVNQKKTELYLAYYYYCFSIDKLHHDVLN